MSISRTKNKNKNKNIVNKKTTKPIVKKKTKILSGGGYEISDSILNIMVNIESKTYINMIKQAINAKSLSLSETMTILKTLVKKFIFNFITILSALSDLNSKGIDEFTITNFIAKLSKKEDDKDKKWIDIKKRYFRINLSIILGLVMMYLPINNTQSINFISKQQLTIINSIIIDNSSKNTDNKIKQDSIKGEMIADIYKVIIKDDDIKEILKNLNENKKSELLRNVLPLSNSIPKLNNPPDFTQYIKTKESVEYLLKFLLQKYLIIDKLKTDTKLLESIYTIKNNSELISKENFSDISSKINITDLTNPNPKKILEIGQSIDTILKTNNPDFQGITEDLTVDKINEELIEKEKNERTNYNTNTTPMIVNNSIPLETKKPIINTTVETVEPETVEPEKVVNTPVETVEPEKVVNKTVKTVEPNTIVNKTVETVVNTPVEPETIVNTPVEQVEQVEQVVEPVEQVVEPIEQVVEPIEQVVEPVEQVVEPIVNTQNAGKRNNKSKKNNKNNKKSKKIKHNYKSKKQYKNKK
jgi:hypothetical protein